MTADRMKAIRDDLRITCPLCNGTRVTKSTSFVDSMNSLEQSCRPCKGRGYILESSDVLAQHCTDLLADLDEARDLLKQVSLVVNGKRDWEEVGRRDQDCAFRGKEVLITEDLINRIDAMIGGE